MSETIEYVLLIGIAQVSFIAFMGFLIASILVRISGSIAASVAGATLVVVAVLTFSIPIPVPNVLSHFESLAQSNSITQRAIDGARRSDDVHDVPVAAPLVNLSDWIQMFLSADESRRPSPFYLIIKRTIYAAIFALVAFGFVKLAVGMIGARRLLRSSRPITDERLCRISQVIFTSMNLKRDVCFVQCDRIPCAAVSGWLRPTVLLPDHWRTWTDEQLHCVLAHELAHVIRGDYAWRLASCLLTSIHYYNPLVHLFVRKLILAQEITADTIAAATMEQGSYLRALSSLALQRDDRDSCFSQTGVHPVFSGYLIRRIKMLNSKRSRTDVRRAATIKWIGIVTIMIVGGLTLASRGIAQPPTAIQDESGPVERVARLDTVKSEQRTDPTSGMFSRHRIDLSSYAENETGFMRVSLSKILQETDLGSAVPLVNELIAHELQNWFASSEKPSIDLNLVDQICGSANLVLRKAQKLEAPTTVGGEGMVAGAVTEVTNDQALRSVAVVGMTGGYVELKQPTDMGNWISKYSPTSETITHESGNYYALPQLSFLGPGKIVTANIDPKRIGFGCTIPDANSINPLVTMLNHHSSTNQSEWADAFNRIDGGLISIVVTDTQVGTPDVFDGKVFENEDADESEIAMAKAIHQIEHTFETMAVGLDLADNAQTLGIRLRFGCKNREDTVKIKESVQLLFDLHQKELPALDAAPDDSDLATLRALHQIFGRAVFNLEDHSNGTSDVYIHTTIDVPESPAAFVTQMIEQELGQSNE